MKIRTKIKAKLIPYTIFLYGIIIIMYHCFYLFPYPMIMNKLFSIYNTNTMITFFSFVYFMKNCVRGTKNEWIKNYIMIMIVSVAIECVYSLIIYPNQTVFITLRIAMSFCVPVLAVVYIKWFEINGGAEKYLEFINIVSFIWNIYIILQRFVYLKNREFLFDFLTYFNDETVYMRNNSLRIGLGFMGECAILYNVAYIISPQNKIIWKKFIHMLIGSVGFYCLLTISQSRADLVYVLAGIVMIIIIGGKRIETIFIRLLAIISGVYIIFFTSSIPKFIQTFQAVGEYTNSISHRVYAISYYIKCFINNPIFGNGLANTRFDSPYFAIEHGDLGWAYYGDVGFLGLMANLGLVSIVLYIIPMVHMGKIVFKIFRKNKEERQAFPAAFYVYMLFSSVSLLTVDRSRIIQMAFAIAYYEHLEITNKKRNLEAIHEKN